MGRLFDVFGSRGRRLKLVFCVVLISLLSTQSAWAASQLSDQTAQWQVFFQTVEDLEGFIENYHTKDVSLTTLQQAALRGMLEALDDPYSQYLTPEDLTSLSSSLEGEYSGIGVTIDYLNGFVTIVGVFNGSPAENAGVKVGDVLISAAGTSLVGKTSADASLLLRGEPGVPVAFEVVRPGVDEVLAFTVTRQVILEPTIEIDDLGGGIHYVGISQFTSDTGRNFPVIMKHLREKNLKGLVLDLRDNPGGLLDSCLQVASELVPSGTVVELRRKELKEALTVETDISPVPTVVLVNGASASCAEILAGAIRDRGVGILVGEQTFGKACVQSIVELNDGMGGIRLTTADYYTPNGISLAGSGLTPDVLVNNQGIIVPPRVVFTRDMASGAVGLDILALQEALTFLGYPIGECDGIFGPKTAAAVDLFCDAAGYHYQGRVTETLVGRVNLLVVEHAKDFQDEVLLKGKEVLESKLAFGEWPSGD